jgi:hypothetical protein
MTLTYGDVRGWQSEPLGQAGDELKKDLTALEESRDKVETQAIPSSWSGLSQFFAQTRRNVLVAQLNAHIEGKRQVRRALYDAEAQVTEIEGLVTDVEGQATAQEFTIANDGAVTDTSTPPTFDNRWEAEVWGSSRQSQAQAIVDDITTILAKAAAADATIADSIPSGHVTDVDEYGTADPEVAERWAQLTEAERRAIIEEMVEEQAEENGVETPIIDWRDESWGSNGQWSDGDPGTVSLNEGLLDDPRLFHTVAHELRHGRQYEAIRDEDDWQFPWEDDPFDEHKEDGITEDQVEQWEENFDDYQSTSDPGVTYEDYFTQPVEEDARDSGREYLDGLTEEDLDRLLEESQ